MKILVTGFDPFDQESINPSIEAVKQLPDQIDDAQEDLVVRELDIPTFLITDHLIERSNGNYQSEYQVSMGEFLSFINNY